MDIFDGSALLNLIKMSLFSLVAGLTGSITTLITGYIWDSAPAVYTLIWLMVGDWILGMWIAIQCSYRLHAYKETLNPKKRAEYTKRKFSIAKFFAIIFSLVFGLWILAISWNLSKSNSIYAFLPGFVYFAFTGAYVLSTYRKATYLGFFSKDFLEILEEKLHIRNLVGKSKDKKEG